MPTKPVEPILYRDLSVVQAKDVIDKHSRLLTELANYGTTVLARCADSARGGENEDVAPFAVYSHMVELTDGIEVLIRQCCPVPAIPLVRSLFEGLLSLEYILDGDRAKRSLAWLASYLRGQVKLGRMLDADTKQGQQFKKTVASDDVARTVTLPESRIAAAAVSQAQSILDRDQFDEVNKEYGELKAKRKGSLPWYALFGGPNSLRQLSVVMGRGAQYEILFRGWSSVVHGQDFRVFRKNDGGGATFNRLRDPARLSDVTTFASNFMLAGTRTMLKGYRPTENMSTWYKAGVRELNLEISRASAFRPNER